MNRLQRYEKLVRQLRQRIFDYPAEKDEKASRVLRKAIAIKAKLTPDSPTDKWGATSQDRRILARHGMTWID